MTTSAARSSSSSSSSSYLVLSLISHLRLVVLRRYFSSTLSLNLRNHRLQQRKRLRRTEQGQLEEWSRKNESERLLISCLTVRACAASGPLGKHTKESGREAFFMDRLIPIHAYATSSPLSRFSSLLSPFPRPTALAFILLLLSHPSSLPPLVFPSSSLSLSPLSHFLPNTVSSYLLLVFLVLSHHPS